jgi:hypothetical protein
MTTPMRKFHDIRAPWTAQTVGMKGDVLDRMERAVAKVRQRLLRATAVLNQAGMIGVGLIDRSWLANLPPQLASRLKQILDTPDG